MKEAIKKGLFILLFVVLLLPYIQYRWPFIDSGVLKGFYTNAPDTKFSWDKWFEGSYQAEVNNYYNDHVGFRPDMLRLTGQIDFTLFHKVDYGGTSVGINNYLFYDNYIDAYYGTDYKGYEMLKGRMLKLKAVQDTLTHLGKTLIVVYAPCKAWYYPEYIPAKLQRTNMLPNNYKTCKRIGDSIGIDQIDYNSVYLAMKDTARELLYAKLGIHWTNYGSILGIDSIIHYIERKRKIVMPHPYWIKTEHTTTARIPDNDMADIANLIFPMAIETYCYPEILYKVDSNTAKPKAIFIGDSYNINFIRTGILNNIFTDWQFWFGFNNVLVNSNWESGNYPKIKDYDWKSALQNSDCVIILNTPKNGNNLSEGFIDSAYSYYYPGQ